MPGKPPKPPRREPLPPEDQPPGGFTPAGGFGRPTRWERIKKGFRWLGEVYSDTPSAQDMPKPPVEPHQPTLPFREKYLTLPDMTKMPEDPFPPSPSTPRLGQHKQWHLFHDPNQLTLDADIGVHWWQTQAWDLDQMGFRKDAPPPEEK